MVSATLATLYTLSLSHEKSMDGARDPSVNNMVAVDATTMMAPQSQEKSSEAGLDTLPHIRDVIAAVRACRKKWGLI